MAPAHKELTLGAVGGVQWRQRGCCSEWDEKGHPGLLKASERTGERRDEELAGEGYRKEQ